ncbi:Fic family protein [Myxococcota bacterium]|nr:Fic family protein [Myxococcota bacterium]
MGTNRDSFRDIDDRTDDLRDLAARHGDIWGEFLRRYELSWIYHENALEGTVLTHAELTSALKGRPIAPDTYGDIRALKMAMDLVRKHAEEGTRKIDMDFVKEIHATIGSNDPEFQAARYRKDIPLHRSYFHDIAQPGVIQPRFAKLLEWADQNDPDDDDAVKFAAQFHHEFMSIFPFAEHTGKTGRLLLNYILIRHGYMPVVFHATERQRYYDTLRLAKKDMEHLLVEMMANCIENGVKFVESTLAERAKIAGRKLSVA